MDAHPLLWSRLRRRAKEPRKAAWLFAALAAVWIVPLMALFDWRHWPHLDFALLFGLSFVWCLAYVAVSAHCRSVQWKTLLGVSILPILLAYHIADSTAVGDAGIFDRSKLRSDARTDLRQAAALRLAVKELDRLARTESLTAPAIADAPNNPLTIRTWPTATAAHRRWHEYRESGRKTLMSDAASDEEAARWDADTLKQDPVAKEFRIWLSVIFPFAGCMWLAGAVLHLAAWAIGRACRASARKPPRRENGARIAETSYIISEDTSNSEV